MNVISCRPFVARAIVRNSGIVSAVMAAILAISAFSQSATAQAATLTLGDQVSDTLLLEQQRLSIVLPEGKWRVSGLIEPYQAGGAHALAVLTKSAGRELQGTILVRAVRGDRFNNAAMWCSNRGGRQAFEPIAGANDHGCWWVRRWTSVLAPKNVRPYWRQAFSHLREMGIEIPRTLVAAGYYLVGAERSLTVEYSFNASQMTVQDVERWARAWQDRVRAAFREQVTLVGRAPQWP